MKIYTVNFEDIVKVYEPYIKSIRSMESEKDAHVQKIEEFKTKMQSIITSSQTLILDEGSKKEKMEEFGKLQNDASKLDNEFRAHLNRLQDETMKRVYGEISEIIKEYSESNSIDMVINNTEVIYFSNKMDLTDSIVTIIKEKGLYTEEMIKEKESV